MQRAMRRMEDKIRRLCMQVLATDEDDELRPMLAELRNTLRQHIEHLRAGLANYPFVIERRVRNGISPSGAPTAQKVVSETSARNRTDRTEPDSKNLSRVDDSAA